MDKTKRKKEKDNTIKYIQISITTTFTIKSNIDRYMYIGYRQIYLIIKILYTILSNFKTIYIFHLEYVFYHLLIWFAAISVFASF